MPADEPDFTFKSGDDWQANFGFTYQPAGEDTPFDLTDGTRWVVEGHLRLKANAPTIAAVMTFSATHLAESVLVPKVDRAQTVTLQAGKTYYGDCQVTDLDGVYGVKSTRTFSVFVESDVTRAGLEPVNVYLEIEEPDDPDDGDVWVDTSTLPGTPLIYRRVDGDWVLLEPAA